MPKPINIHYGNITTDPLTEDTLYDSVEMNKIADKIEACVSNILKQRLSVDDPYQHVYTNEVSIAHQVALSSADREITTHQRNLICGLLVARSHMRGEAVHVKDPINNTLSPLLCSGELPSPVERKVLSLWDRFLLFFGIGTRKLTQIAENAEAVKDGQERVSQTIFDDLHSTIENNHCFREKHNAYATYKKNVSDTYDRINDMYVKDLAEEIKVSPALGKLAPGEKPSLYKMKAMNNYTPRSNDNILTCMMLQRGHSLKDIADVNFTTDRGEVGKEMLQMINDIASEDFKVSHKAQEKLGNIYLDGAKKFLQQDMPPENDCKDFLNSKSPVYDFMIHRLGHDLYQEFFRDSNYSEFILPDPRNAVLSDMVSAASSLGNQYAIGKVHASSWDNFVASVDNNTVLICESLRNFTNAYTDYSGKTIGDFINKNQGEHEANWHSFKSHVVDFVSKFDPLDSFSLSPHDLYDDKINLYDMCKDDVDYLAGRQEGLHLQEKAGGGYEKRTAKADLAVATADLFLFDQKDTITPLERFRMASTITESPAFISHVDKKSPEEIKKLIHNSEYLNKLVQSFAPSKAKAIANQNFSEPKHEKVKSDTLSK